MYVCMYVRARLRKCKNSNSFIKLGSAWISHVVVIVRVMHLKGQNSVKDVNGLIDLERKAWRRENCERGPNVFSEAIRLKLHTYIHTYRECYQRRMDRKDGRQDRYIIFQVCMILRVGIYERWRFSVLSFI